MRTARFAVADAASPGGRSARFAFVLLTFWGINLLSPSHNS